MQTSNRRPVRQTARLWLSLLGATLALVPALSSCRTVRSETSDAPGSSGAPVETEAPATPDMHSAIEAANRALEERYRAGNLLGVADMYTDDGLLLGPGGYRVEGREAIDEYWSRTTDPVDWTLDIDTIDGNESEGLAYELGTSTLVSKHDGEPRASVVDFMLVWQRQADGSWKILVDTYWHAD